MNDHTRLSRYTTACILALGALLIGPVMTGCGNEESVSSSRVVVTNRSSSALTLGELVSANGSYGAACTNRSGTWSLGISDAGTYAALSVVKGNTACVLTLTDMTLGGDGYGAVPTIALADAYQGTASAFAPPDGGVTAFYGNAKLDSVAFVNDFQVNILFSDDVNPNTAAKDADFAVQTASATAVGVPAPDYSIVLTSLTIQTDNADVVQSATGSAGLTAGLHAGQNYVILSVNPGTSYAQVDGAFTSATPTLMGDNVVQAAEFNLVGATLTDFRYVIIANTLEGIPSYQVLTITFTKPTR